MTTETRAEHLAHLLATRPELHHVGIAGAVVVAVGWSA